MFGEKGISPLIAAVVLIAFVIAVAGIASTFFTGFTKEQKSGVESKAEDIIECSVATLELDKDIVVINKTRGDFVFAVANTGKEDLTGLKIIIYNESYAGTCDVTPSSITVGSTITVAGNNCTSVPSSGRITKVQLTTSRCPGVKSELTNRTDTITETWRVTA